MQEIIEVISIKNIVIYFIIINVIGFLAMGIDKYKAKKDMWRIPEKTLFLIAILGGGIGSLIGMYLFKHKTKKAQFQLGIPVILITEIVIIIYLLYMR